MATQVNVSFVQNETWVLQITFTDIDGNVIDLTGGTVQYRIASAEALMLDLASPATIAVPTPTNGTAIVQISSAMQNAANGGAGFVAGGQYFHEARATLASGLVTDQLIGTVTVLPSLFKQFP